MTTKDREALTTVNSFVEQFGIYMAEYLDRAKELGKPIDVTALKDSVGYAFSMREASGAEGAIDVGVVASSDAPIELDERMIAESHRLAALGKVRPMREFLDERRSTNAKH